MRLKPFFLLLGAALFVPMADATGEPNQADRQGQFVPAHHAHGNKRAAYMSPDGLYVARLRFEDGEVKDEVVVLTISRNGSKEQALSTFAGVEGFVWGPQQRHTFVVSTDGGHNGTGILAVWTAEKGTKVLLRGKDLESDHFDVKRISRDGKKVIYEHFGYGVDERHPEHGSGLHQLILPY